jgi:hypothetical protein
VQRRHGVRRGLLGHGSHDLKVSSDGEGCVVMVVVVVVLVVIIVLLITC